MHTRNAFDMVLGPFEKERTRAPQEKVEIHTIVIHPIVRMVICDNEIASEVIPCWIVTRNLLFRVAICCHLRHSGNGIERACGRMKSRHTTSTKVDVRNEHKNITQTETQRHRDTETQRHRDTESPLNWWRFPGSHHCRPSPSLH